MVWWRAPQRVTANRKITRGYVTYVHHHHSLMPAMGHAPIMISLKAVSQSMLIICFWWRREEKTTIAATKTRQSNSGYATKKCVHGVHNTINERHGSVLTHLTLTWDSQKSKSVLRGDFVFKLAI